MNKTSKRIAKIESLLLLHKESRKALFALYTTCAASCKNYQINEVDLLNMPKQKF